MLAYAANRPVAGKRPSSPPAMLLIVSAHVALIALAMSAKMEFERKPADQRTIVSFPIEPPPPPPNPTADPPKQSQLPMSNPRPSVPLPPTDPTLDAAPTIDPGPVVAGGGASGIPQFPSNLIPAPVRHEARLLTRPDELKPPYPVSKLLGGEEATLQLRLSINEYGRVTMVEPVGAADRVFLEAARRYLMAHWRYQPATEDGRAVASTMVINLRFQLDG